MEENNDNLYWKEFRNSVYLNKTKSEDDFEKYINILATGGLILGFTFLDKIYNRGDVIYISLIIFGLLIFVFTLLVNLYSHHLSKTHSEIMISEIDSKNYEDLIFKTPKRNRIINILNRISMFSLLLAICFTIIFIIINLYNMNNTNKNQEPKSITVPINPTTGRTNPTPNYPAPKPNK